MKDKPYVIGLDLGGTNSVFGIVDKDAKIVSTVSVPTAGHGSADAYVKNCTAAIMPLIEEVGGITKIKAMGIGAPNANYYSGCIEDAPNLEWRGNIPLVKMFQESLGIPVVMTNDANAAAIGEMTYGAARGMKNFIEITLGTGVGSGIVVNGQLIYGSDGFAGELGHVIVEKNGRDCGCGRKGCLECYCSGTGIARSALEKLANSRKPSVLREKLSSKLEAKDVHLSAQDGDELALEILAETGRRLGEACANFATFCSILFKYRFLEFIKFLWIKESSIYYIFIHGSISSSTTKCLLSYNSRFERFCKINRFNQSRNVNSCTCTFSCAKDDFLI